MRRPGELRAQRADGGRGAVRVGGSDIHVSRAPRTDTQSASISPDTFQTLVYILPDQKTLLHV